MCDANRDRLMAWAQANGLDPERIVANTEVVIEDGRITVQYFDSSRKTVGNEPLKRPHTVPLVEGWPTDLVDPYPNARPPIGLVGP